MFYKVTNLKLPITSSFDEVFSACQKKLGLCKSDIISKKILKKSIDARRREVNFIYTVLIETDKSVKETDNIKKVEIEEKTPLIQGNTPLRNRPVVVGFGPCGMFCALTLARLGYNPIVFERGADVDERTKKVNNFWLGGALDTNTNVQFGEGGAGTFSDGKLTCRIGDERIDSILSDFVRFGAPDDITYQALPHIGTDILKHIVKSIREEIISLGGSVHFNTGVSDIIIKDGELKSLVLSDGDEVFCDVAVFAIGHSARDTYEMLYRRGLSMMAKTFSVGFRCEHLQKDIDYALYGDYAGDERLGPASYKVSHRAGDVGCYSFCMCPGGVVVAGNSTPNTIVVNGMSNFDRLAPNSNSALVVNVTQDDVGQGIFAGVKFQQRLEETCFNAVNSGNHYLAPAQNVVDFLNKRKSTEWSVTPSYPRGVVSANLWDILPDFVCNTLAEALVEFGKKMHGFDKCGVLTAVESRTSSPVKMLRNKETFASTTLCNLYPCGEGAGYAGGIVSAGVDGLKVAQAICTKYQN